MHVGDKHGANLRSSDGYWERLLILMVVGVRIAGRAIFVFDAHVQEIVRIAEMLG